MRSLRLLVPGLALAALALPGCWLISGQFTVSADLPSPLTIAGATSLVAAPIDLSTSSEYKDNKDKLKDLVDCALLGTFKNTGGTAVDIEVWMTPAITTYTTEAALNLDGTKVLVWGPFKLAPGATRVIGWDESAALFSRPGKLALFADAKADGRFTLYAKGKTGPYQFQITKGVAVVVIDAGT